MNCVQKKSLYLGAHDNKLPLDHWNEERVGNLSWGRRSTKTLLNGRGGLRDLKADFCSYEGSYYTLKRF